MAYTLLAHGSYQGGLSGGTSGAFNLGSPDLLIVFMTFQSPTPPTLTDSAGNTYTLVVCPVTILSGNNYLRMYYAATGNGGVTGGSSVTFTMTGSNTSPCIFFLSYTGSRTSSNPYVSTQGGGRDGVSGTTVANAAISSTSGSLLATGFFNFTDQVSSSVDSSFTLRDQVNFLTSTAYGGASADKISTGASETVTWTAGSAQLYLQTMISEFAAAPTGSVNTSNFFFGA